MNNHLPAIQELTRRFGWVDSVALTVPKTRKTNLHIQVRHRMADQKTAERTMLAYLHRHISPQVYWTIEFELITEPLAKELVN